MGSMGSLFIGVSGLTSNQSSLNTTAHNLANVDTKGYVRQQVVHGDLRYHNLGVTHYNTLQKGLGSSIMSVRQVREIYLDQAYRREIGRQAFYEAQAESTKEIEDLFGELEGVQFQKSLQDLWSSIQEVAKEPDSITTRAALISTSVSFIERAEKIVRQLDRYQLELNKQIEDNIKKINSLGEGIRELNKKISRYESSGVEKANDLRDERNNLLDELGKIAKISYFEDKNSVVEISIEGTQFLMEDNLYKMGTKLISENSPMLIPTWIHNNNDPVYNLDNIPSSLDNTDIGSLLGILLSRGSYVADFTHIPIKGEDGNNIHDGQVYNEAVTKYNKEVESSIVSSTRAKFDQLVHGIVTMINDILSPNTEEYELTHDVYDEKGMLIYAAGDKIRILDKDKAPVGMDEESAVGEALFNRKSVDRYMSEMDLEVIDSNGNLVSLEGARIYNKEDKSGVYKNYSLFTIGEIEVNKKIMTNYSVLPLSKNTGSDEFDIKTVEKIIQEWQKPFATLSPNTVTKNKISDYYNYFFGEIANKGEQFINTAKHQEEMVNEIDNQRMSVTAVSSDEELTSLIKFQHGYNAAARYVNVIDEMLEHIIMRLGY